jgi:hypothetical protein
VLRIRSNMEKMKLHLRQIYIHMHKKYGYDTFCKR